MKWKEFEGLDRVEQLDYLQEEGVYVGKRKIVGNTILLYQVDTFYVELYYTKHRLSVKRIRCFQSMTLLDPYLDHIVIEHFV